MGGLCARSIFCVNVFWIFVFALLLCASLGKLCAEVETVCPRIACLLRWWYEYRGTD